jgi:hypothetical protein
MIKKIERPNWPKFLYNIEGTSEFDFGEWFNTHIEPINKALDKAVEVYGWGRDDGANWSKDSLRSESHKALLINIEPIKQESFAAVLEEIACYGVTVDRTERAKAALSREECEG